MQPRRSVWYDEIQAHLSSPDFVRHTLGLHYLRLEPASRRRQFMAVLPDPWMRMIADLASPEIVLGIKADGGIVGGLEIFAGPAKHAEIGVSVEDAYQGRGFGRVLFLDRLCAAQRIDIRTADHYFASENSSIRRLVDAAGGHIIQHGPTCESHIDIPQCGADTETLEKRNGRLSCAAPQNTRLS